MTMNRCLRALAVVVCAGLFLASTGVRGSVAAPNGKRDFSDLKPGQSVVLEHSDGKEWHNRVTVKRYTKEEVLNLVKDLRDDDPELAASIESVSNAVIGIVNESYWNYLGIPVWEYTAEGTWTWDCSALLGNISNPQITNQAIRWPWTWVQTPTAQGSGSGTRYPQLYAPAEVNSGTGSQYVVWAKMRLDAGTGRITFSWRNELGTTSETYSFGC